MDDTKAEFTEKMCEMIRSKSPEERLKMGCSMNETSRKLVTQSILRQHPGLSKNRLQQELFLRYYQSDFDSNSCVQILDHLDQH
jgi:hypothetical protein